MRFARRQRPDGIALIIVMITVMILTILAGGFAYSMKVEMRLAMNARNYAELEWLGRSGMEYAKWVLAEDMKLGPFDTPNDIWAGGDGGMFASNSPLAEVRLPATIQLGKGEVTIHPMEDLDRKLNINRVTDVVLQKVLMDMGVDAGEVSVIVSSIRDWIDENDTEELQGAESSYYESSDPPYEARNGPMDDLSELLLIQGVTQEMYDGGGGIGYVWQRNPRGGRGRYVEAELPSYPFGLKDVFTTISSGFVNGRTADARVLALLPGMDETLAAQYIQMRAGPDGQDGTDDDMPADLSFIIPDPIARGMAQQIMPAGQQTSVAFKVVVDAQIGDSRRSFEGILVRAGGGNIQLVDFRPRESASAVGQPPGQF